ncbi:MAG: hypothetical protein C0613_14085 [Desulfobulbaceae bacterium]|nr:MAG: hypothetical protein C0613_14085 [Desulfobulbaceae bacterium]
MQLSAYHFPETDIATADLRNQLLFFDQLIHLKAHEGDTEDQDELCPAYTPAPLAEDLPRFKQLLAELKGNEAAFYQGQLSNMALEYLENRDPDTISHIINTLQGSATTTAPSAQRHQLWQARLLLKLAELLCREQRELQEDLTRANQRQGDLLKELKGEAEMQDLMPSLAEVTAPHFPIHLDKLIKAWGHLMLAGDRQPWCLHCFTNEAAEALFEVNEVMSGKRPSRLLRLPLPQADVDPHHYETKRQTWRQEVAECREQLAGELQAIAAQGPTSSSLTHLSRLAALWTSAHEQHNPWSGPTGAPVPAKGCATPHLEIYLLSQPITTLLARLCGRKHTATAAPQWSHGLLALPSRRTATCKG